MGARGYGSSQYYLCELHVYIDLYCSYLYLALNLPSCNGDFCLRVPVGRLRECKGISGSVDVLQQNHLGAKQSNKPPQTSGSSRLKDNKS